MSDVTRYSEAANLATIKALAVEVAQRLGLAWEAQGTLVRHSTADVVLLLVRGRVAYRSQGRAEAVGIADGDGVDRIVELATWAYMRADNRS